MKRRKSRWNRPTRDFDRIALSVDFGPDYTPTAEPSEPATSARDFTLAQIIHNPKRERGNSLSAPRLRFGLRKTHCISRDECNSIIDHLLRPSRCFL